MYIFKIYCDIINIKDSSSFSLFPKSENTQNIGWEKHGGLLLIFFIIWSFLNGEIFCWLSPCPINLNIYKITI